VQKVFPSAAAAVSDLRSGSSIAVGGFGMAGSPLTLIEALRDQGAEQLEIISNNCGTDGGGLGLLLESHRVRRIVASYVGENREFARQFLSGEVEVELTPQGTLAERLRAGGAGIGAFYTPTGVGTLVAQGGLPWRYSPDGSIAKASPAKELRPIEGRFQVLEYALRADFALVHAQVADTAGNARFHASARNFNPLAAMAAEITVLEAEEVVPAGELDPDSIHLAGIHVDRVVALTAQQSSNKIVERLTLRGA